MTTKSPSNMERHAQSVILAILTALALYIGNTVNNTSQEVVKLQAYVARLQLDLASLTLDFRNANDNRLRESDVKRDFELRDARLNILEAEVDNLKGKKNGK